MVKEIGAFTTPSDSKIPETAPKYWRHKYFEFYPDTLNVIANGKEERLNPMERGLLLFLWNHPNRVLRFAEILKNVWGKESPEITDRYTLRMTLSRLRQKLGQNKQRPIIETLRSFGLRLIDEDRPDESLEANARDTGSFVWVKENLQYFESSGLVIADDKKIELSYLQNQTMMFLARQEGQPVVSSQILSGLRQSEGIILSRPSLQNTIFAIRGKLEKLGADLFEVIKSGAPWEGYKLVGFKRVLENDSSLTTDPAVSNT